MAICPICRRNDLIPGRQQSNHVKACSNKRAQLTTKRPHALSTLRDAREVEKSPAMDVIPNDGELSGSFSMVRQKTPISILTFINYIIIQDIELDEFVAEESIPEIPERLITPPPAPLLSRSGRPTKFPARRYQDLLPGKASGMTTYIPVALPVRAPAPREITPALSEPDPEPLNTEPVRTEPDEFGRFRIYQGTPTSDPDDMVSLDMLADSPNFAKAPELTPAPSSAFGITAVTETATKLFAPFLNMSVFRLMNWYYAGSTMKSLAELDKLVNEVILAPDFDAADLVGFRASTENSRLDKHEMTKGADGVFSSIEGWTESSVNIRLPAEKFKFAKEEDAPLFKVPGLHHRDITEVIKSVYEGDTFFEMNTMPYKEYVQKSPDEPPQRVWGETYTANTHYNFHEEVQKVPRAAGDTMEHVVAGMQVWSDSTHLANFGSAALWPVYLYFSNQSKYTRAKPTSFASHHIAYLPVVSFY